MSVRWIAFHITDRCQLNCLHCARDPALKAKDIDVDFVDYVLAEARRLYEPEEVALTGGEPTLHPRFYDIVDAAVAHGYDWHMVSNGERFAQVLARLDERPERLERMSAVTFSLDGAEEATHDEVRGEGSFRTVMSAIAIASARDVPFVLQMTPTRVNESEIEAFGLLAAQLGARNVLFSALQPSATMHDWSLFLSFAEHRRIVERIRRLDSILSIPVRPDDGFFLEPFYVCSTFTSHTLHFDYDGQLNLCCRYSGIAVGGDEADALADVRTTGLAAAHARMIEVGTDTLQARIRALDAGFTDPWDASSCNFCLKLHGKPHWTATGPAGPQAERQRWRGAWTPDPDLVALAERRRAEVAGREDQAGDTDER